MINRLCNLLTQNLRLYQQNSSDSIKYKHSELISDLTIWHCLTTLQPNQSW